MKLLVLLLLGIVSVTAKSFEIKSEAEFKTKVLESKVPVVVIFQSNQCKTCDPKSNSKLMTNPRFAAHCYGCQNVNKRFDFFFFFLWIPVIDFFSPNFRLKAAADASGGKVELANVDMNDSNLSGLVSKYMPDGHEPLAIAVKDGQVVKSSAGGFSPTSFVMGLYTDLPQRPGGHRRPPASHSPFRG